MQHDLHIMKAWYKTYIHISRQKTVVTEQIAFNPQCQLIVHLSVVFQHQNVVNQVNHTYFNFQNICLFYLCIFHPGERSNNSPQCNKPLFVSLMNSNIRCSKHRYFIPSRRIIWEKQIQLQAFFVIENSLKILYIKMYFTYLYNSLFKVSVAVNTMRKKSIHGLLRLRNYDTANP